MTTQPRHIDDGPNVQAAASRILRKRLWRSSELADIGISNRQVHKLVESGTLVRLRRGCYITGEAWRPLTRQGRQLHRVYAHRYSLMPGTSQPVYSHSTAALLHGLALWNVPDLIHVTLPFKTSPTGHGPDVRTHFQPLDSGQITIVRGLQATTVEQTVLDCARLLDYPQALIIADSALRRGADLGLMQTGLKSLANRPGVPRARKVLDHASGLSESAGETLTRAFMRRIGIPEPEQQLRVRTRMGDHRLDFAWKEHKLALEFDGDSKYFEYAPTAEVLLAERKREKALMEEGWQFLRIEWRDLFREEELRSRILRALQKAQLSGETG